MKENELPRWDMTNIYPSLDSDEFKADWQILNQMIKDLQEYVAEHNIGPDATFSSIDPQEIGGICATFLEDFSTASILAVTINNYIYSFFSTDTSNEDAKKAMHPMQELSVEFNHLENVLFKGWLSTFGDRLPEIIESHQITREHAFYLTEMAQQSNYMMSTAEEKLAGELSLYGSNSWSIFSEEVKSKLSWTVKDEQDEEKELPISAILNLMEHPDNIMRRRGYEAAVDAFSSVEDVLAAALNGVKGTQLVVSKFRNRQDVLSDSLDKSRIDRATLDAMLEAVRSAFPKLRKFYLAKARQLGKERLPIWDLFASTTKITTHFSYELAQIFILENFAKFSNDLAGLARKAFDNNWIDVGPREGKIGGGFCMVLYAAEESRILLNYEENLNAVFGLAHELGHAFHNYCLRGQTRYHRRYPMTLAETASLMCETIVTNAAIEHAKTVDEEVAILEASLISAIGNYIAGPYMLYHIETEVYKRLAESRISAKDLNKITEDVQIEIFGETLDENYCFKYWWARWGHLFFYNISFYNYDYIFGLLFCIGLYAVYEDRGSEFVPQYMELLASAGKGTAADLAAKFDIDLRSPGFWERGLAVIGQRIDRYASLIE